MKRCLTTIFALAACTPNLERAPGYPDATTMYPPDPPDAGPPPPACAFVGGLDPNEAAGGRLFVLVADGLNAIPIPIANAQVALDLPDQRLEATTDENGCASFVDAAITPPYTVSVFASGYRYESVRGDPRLVQSYLLDRNPLPDFATLTAHVEGTIPNIALTGAITGDTARYARVLSGSRIPGSRPMTQPPRVDPSGFFLNEILVDGPFTLDTYQLAVSPLLGPVDLFALAGNIYPSSPGIYGAIDLLYFGYAPNIAVTANATVTADVELSLPLDTPITFDTYGAPGVDGFTGTAVVYGIETDHGTFLPLGQTIDFIREPQGVVPALAPPLGSALYGGAALVGGQRPYRYLRALADPTNGDVLYFHRWIQQVGDPLVEGRRISAEVDPTATWCELRTWRSDAGTDWHLRNYDGAIASFELPTPPLGVEDRAGGETGIEIRCVLENDPRTERFVADAVVRTSVTMTP